MAYITKEYYDEVYGGAEIENTAFLKLVKRASADINRLSMYQIERIGFFNLSEFEKTLVQEATAIQVEYLDLNGAEATAQGITHQGFSIGNYSENKGDKISRGIACSPAVLDLLTMAGLLSATVVSKDSSYMRGGY